MQDFSTVGLNKNVYGVFVCVCVGVCLCVGVCVLTKSLSNNLFLIIQSQMIRPHSFFFGNTANLLVFWPVQFLAISATIMNSLASVADKFCGRRTFATCW